MQYNPLFQYVHRNINYNAALVEMKMFLWTSKSSRILQGLACWGKGMVSGQATNPDTIYWWTVKILQFINAFWLPWSFWSTAPSTHAADLWAGGTVLEDLSRHLSSSRAIGNIPARIRCKRVPRQNPKESHSEIPPSLMNHAHMAFILTSDATFCTVIYLISQHHLKVLRRKIFSVFIFPRFTTETSKRVNNSLQR